VSCRVGLMRMVASRGSRERRSVPARGTSTWFCVVKYGSLCRPRWTVAARCRGPFWIACQITAQHTK
jgi:hypothetical protein